MATTTTFDSPTALGAKIIPITHTVTNTSGAYSSTIQDARITPAMQAIKLDIDDPSVFRDKINVACNNGSVTISCNDVVGSTSVKISVIKVDEDPTAVTSIEFDVLNNKITKLSGELAVVIDGNKTAIGAAEGDYVLLKNSTISGKDDGAYTATKAIPANTVIDATYLSSIIDKGIANALNSNAFQILYNGTHVMSFKIGNLYGLTFHNYTNASEALGNGGKLSDYNLPNPTGKAILVRFLVSNGTTGECLIHYINNEWQITFYSSGFYSYIAPANVNVTLLYSVDE